MSRRRVLVVANETLAGDVLCELLDSGSKVVVVAPALTGRVAFWSSDERRARRGAEERLTRCLAVLQGAGFHAQGWVGDANPLLAMEDALRIFPAGEIVVATHPEGRSNWLAHDIVGRARDRFPQRIHHIVVDTSRGREFLAA